MNQTDASKRKLAYSIAEVADQLGMHRATIHRLVQAGKLKAISGFGVLRISAGELDRFLSDTREYSPMRSRRGKAVAA